jgi:hypothetical protein
LSAGRGTLESTRAAAGRAGGAAAHAARRQEHNLLRAIIAVVRCAIALATNISNISNTSNTCRWAETYCEPARERFYFLPTQGQTRRETGTQSFRSQVISLA